jgi:hypothetical protein
MDYRNHFFQKFTIPQIVDFTHLRRKLFNKDVSTVAVFVKNIKPKLNEKIWHIIANRTKKEENKLFFLFDHYDFHIINYHRALEERYIWKSNLLGGGRLGRIVDRLNKINRTIKKFIDSKNWIYIRGYFIGNKSKKAEYITNQYYLPENAFTDKGIDYSKIEIEIENGIENISKENVFIKPQLLIKRSISDNGIIPIQKVDFNEVEKYKINKNIITKDRLCFRHGILGIHYNQDGQDTINSFIENFIKYNLTYSFLITIISGAMLVRKEKVFEKADIDSLPYPEDEIELELSEIETVWRDDVLDYYIHQAKSPDNNPMNKNIEDVKKQLSEYGAVFCKVMNASYKYKKEYSFKQGQSFESPSFIATCFHYTDKDIKFEFSKENDKKLKDYFIQITGRNKLITRIVKFYDGNDIWIIKPRQMRYWLKSIADRDAIDCINDILMNKK